MKLIFVVSVVAMLLRGAEAQCSGNNSTSTCKMARCCSPTVGNICEWVETCAGGCFRKRELVANLTQILGNMDKQTEVDILHTDLPIPAAVAHLRSEIE